MKEEKDFLIMSNRKLSDFEKERFPYVRADIDADSEDEELELNNSIPYLFTYHLDEERFNIIAAFPTDAFLSVME